MKHFSIIIFLCLAITFFTSCKQKSYAYPDSKKLTNEKGIPNDSLSFYFSTFQPFDSSQTELTDNKFRQQRLSANLYAFKEPVLYNSYLGKDEYRFLWLRSFHLPMVFTIANEDGNITLTTKKLDRQPLFRDEKYMDEPEQDSFYIKQGYTLLREMQTFKNGTTQEVTIVKADRKANIIYDSTLNLTTQQWRNFKVMIYDAEFWNLKPCEWAGAADGAVWVIEGHTREAYKFILRQSPGGNIRKVGEMLIKLSGLKEEIY